ncbi:hypothetical protein AB0L99_24525 [Streptomyces sp. NPDC051954]|uniref:hypothetical protein n=1 Tax=unclassified Streptomyces TaxID=2593676 RepID=UPI00343082C4
MRLLRLPFIFTVALTALLGTLASPASAVERTCWGATGNFNADPVLLVDWKRNASECFGIAPSGSIWHTWDGAGKWYEMPGNGSGESLVGGYDVFSSNDLTTWVGKAVKVSTTTHNDYCIYLDYATNTWGGWYAVSSNSSCAVHAVPAVTYDVW